ncbi:MAG: TIM-barrel domain-containing protein [Planctomycetota bacterium]|jgi:alpha-glucosidase (family GH31 glycosyl hydrolase)
MKPEKMSIQVVFCQLLVVIVCSGVFAAEVSKEVAHADPAFTGPAPICPRWAFEPWIWEDNKNTQQAVLKVVQGYIDRDIPVGTIIIDSPWETSYNSLQWDRNRYPQPQKMIDELHSRGVRVIMWITGAMNRTSKDAPEDKAPGYDHVIAKGWAVNNGTDYQWWKGWGVHVDFTIKEARDWFGSQMAPVIKMGVDGWKVDEAEQYIPTPIITSLGTTDRSVLKHYYYAAIADQSKKYNPESIVLTRPFSASVNKSTVSWGGDYPGDWGGLAGQVRRLYPAAIAGYSAPCVEVGGFLGAAPSKESLIRYAQFGALMPVMNNGGSNGGLTNHLPWFHDEETTNIYRYYAILHSEISDYLFSCSVDAHLNGGSIVKSPDIEKAQHLLGEWIFASFVIGPENSKEVVLPDTGRWIDYWNEDKLYAPKTQMKLDVPLSRTPIFIRAGAIIPMRVRNDVTGHGDASSADKRTILVYPYERSSYLYHCNRNSGTEYDDIKLTMDEKAGILKVESKTPVSYRFRIISFAAPKTVTGADSWTYDKKDQCIIVDKKGSSFSIQIHGMKAYSAVSVEP